MGASATRSVIARRSRWRAYLLLARVSNLPTVWSNVLAGATAAMVAVDGVEVGFASGAAWDVPLVLRAAVALSLFYCGGMVLNDVCDAGVDSRARAERPIPRRDVSRTEALGVAVLLMAVGEVLLAPNALALRLGLALAAAVAIYNLRHKGNPIAPIVMGACRALVYAIAAAVVAGSVPPLAAAGALVMGAYVVGLTLVARWSGPKARWRVPLLLAGISLVDGAFIGIVSRSAPLAFVAALGFPLTLLLQRAVPGD